MLIYLYTKMIFLYKCEDLEYLELLSQTVIWYIPIVNLDTYKFNYEYY